MMKLLLSFLLVLSTQSLSFAAAHIDMLSGVDIVSSKPVKAEAEKKKGVVVVFLSAVCPCSNSHVQELRALTKKFPDFAFFGVHSNTDEKKEPTQAYFKNVNMPFPVIHDFDAKIADLFKASKTPHVFVLKANGEPAYSGGVSSSRNFDNADRKYLREALTDLQQDRSVRTPEGRTLGCVITRGEKDVW